MPGVAAPIFVPSIAPPFISTVVKAPVPGVVAPIFVPSIAPPFISTVDEVTLPVNDVASSGLLKTNLSPVL